MVFTVFLPVKEALESENAQEWINAMDCEFKSLIENNTWHYMLMICCCFTIMWNMLWILKGK